MDVKQIIFFIVSAVILTSAFAVVTVRNLVHAALSLIVTLFGVAVLFVLLDAGFLAAVQVVLYIGAIAILIIFAIMLTRRVMQDTGTQVRATWWIGAAIALAIMVGLGLTVPVTGFSLYTGAMPTTDPVVSLGFAFVDPNQYALPFEVASVLLLMALVGSIVVASDKKEELP